MGAMAELHLKILNLYNAGYGINRIAKELKIKKSVVKEVIEIEKEEEQKEIAVSKVSKVSNDKKDKMLVNDSIDKDKLNLLLNNLDSLLELVNKANNTNSTTEVNLDSNSTKVTSLRINKDIYSKIKQRADKENKSISNIVNRALIDYLNNYL